MKEIVFISSTMIDWTRTMFKRRKITKWEHIWACIPYIFMPAILVKVLFIYYFLLFGGYHRFSVPFYVVPLLVHCYLLLFHLHTLVASGFQKLDTFYVTKRPFPKLFGRQQIKKYYKRGGGGRGELCFIAKSLHCRVSLPSPPCFFTRKTGSPCHT